MKLQGKVSVVTAAGQGIGRAIADRLLADGAEVHASDLNAGLLAGFGGTVSALDATNAEAVAAYFAAFPRIDVLVHAVGYVHQGSIEETTLADWRRSQSITLDSAFLVLQAAIPVMKRTGGSIVTIASVRGVDQGVSPPRRLWCAQGRRHRPDQGGGADYLRQGIRANAVCPGTVDSPSLRQRVADLVPQLGSEEAAWKFFLDRQPSGRLGTPEEIAGIVAWLASDEAVFMTGQTVNVDGGITI